MPLSAGSRLGCYEILAPIGSGGMGEVYRARDSKLNRDVAIKVLPTFANDPDRMARFEREAQVLASLNHPHIAAIYGLQESDGMRALVMELVEGPTLDDHIGGHAMALEEALPIAKQIAEALEYAHEKGIIHRDLKPANVKLTTDGHVKVLDFGLAKALEAPAPAAGNPSISPTLTIEGTRAGMILGTAAYMSPEQARGKAVDKRADIWSFGVVLYEMLTGKQPFAGATVSDTLAAVLKTEPDLTQAPVQAQKLLRRCLDKDPKCRLRDIGDVWELLEQPSMAGASQRRSKLPWAVAAALAVVSIGLGVALWRATRQVDRALMRLSVDLGPDAVAGQFTTAAISPDGTRLVFPLKSSDGKQMLATRLLEETKPALLSGTENGRDPFFSPDGRWIGFFADGKMKKISIQGGAPIALCDAPDARGANWGADSNIIVAPNRVGGLSRVSAEGGTPQPVTKLEGGGSHRWPQPLLGNEAVLFTLSFSNVVFGDASIAAVSLKTGEIKILVRDAYFGRYLPTGDSTGHLVYIHDGVLFGVPFDPARLELRGTPVPVLEGLAADPTSGAGQFSFSRTGTLVHRTGKVAAPSWPVSWLDNSGNAKPLIATPGFYLAPRFSPDGKRLALAQFLGSHQQIFVYDLQRRTMSRVFFKTGTQRSSYPIWSPDGNHIVCWFSSASGFSLGWMRADGAGETQSLLDSKNLLVPYSFFPDGRLAYFELDPESGWDIWTLPLDLSDPDRPKPGKKDIFLRTASNELNPAVSPDGRWIAYQSDDLGRYEVYVGPFDGQGGKRQISTGGGQLPMWSRNGRELFFENLDNRIMVIDYTATGASFTQQGKPRLWSEQQLHEVGGMLNYDLWSKGKLFAIFPELRPQSEEKGDVHVAFLLNFFDELRRRAPVSK